MSFVPENALERSLVKAASDPAYAPQFYKDFAHSDIFIVQHGRHPPENAGRRRLEEGTEIEIVNIDFNGEPHIPIFSSVSRLQATLTGEATYLGMKALDFLEMTRGTALLLNPGSDYGKEITAQEAASIVDGSIWRPDEHYVAQHDTQVVIGQPTKYPTELIEALTHLFKRDRRVKRAWIALHFNPDMDQEQPHTLIAIEVTDRFDEVLSEAGVVVGNVNIPDPPVDFLPITGHGGIEDYFTKETKPFYKRRFLGLF